MKFSCEQCKTKYSIADERIRGKVLKIRCKYCAHIMTVRQDVSAVGPARDRGVLQRAMDQALKAPPSGSFGGSDTTMVGRPDGLLGDTGIPAGLDLEEWHLSVDGQASGPIGLDALAKRIVVAMLGDREIFIWRDGFDDWLAPADVPEVWAVMERLRPGLKKPPRGPTEPIIAALSEAPAKPVSTHPVDRVESFEFSELAPTTSVPRPPAVLQAAPAPVATADQTLAELPPRDPASSRSPSSTRSSSSTRSGGTPAPGKGRSAQSSKAPRSSALSEALASLSSGGSGERAAPPPLPQEPPPREAPRAGQAPPSELVVSPASLPYMPAVTGADRASSGELRVSPASLDHLPAVSPPDADPDLRIGDPSVMIDLAVLAGKVKHPPPPRRDQTPAVPPPADVQPAVLVIAGPAPAAPAAYLKTVLSAALGACVLLIGLVVYLLVRPSPHPPGDGPEVKKEQGKALTDKPVQVTDDPVTGRPSQTEPGGKKNGRKPPKLPAAANGKTGLNGNAATLAKLYEDGSGSSPVLPEARKGASTTESRVSETEIQDVMRKNQKSLTPCYDRVLKHDESLRRARIDIKVKVGISGLVTQVSVGSAYAGTELGGCLQQTIRRWHFPISESEYETQFPLILTAN